jgi:hypothetical protein
MLNALKKAVGMIEDSVNPNPLTTQEGGRHYKNMAIQPIEFIHKNNIPYLEGCAIKYLCRHREKGGLLDLKKAKHYIDCIIELEYKNQL